MNDIPWIHTKDGVKDLKLKIIASGGISIIPSLFCKCKICEERTLFKKTILFIVRNADRKSEYYFTAYFIEIKGE